jgi:hypothetical protein
MNFGLHKQVKYLMLATVPGSDDAWRSSVTVCGGAVDGRQYRGAFASIEEVKMPVFPEDDNLGDEQLFGENGEEDDFGEEAVDPQEELDSMGSLWTDEAKAELSRFDLSEQSLQSRLASADPATARPYAMGATYSPGELILHEQFGLGLVTRALTGKKMEVVFQDTSRLMVMNYTPHAGQPVGTDR